MTEHNHIVEQQRQMLELEKQATQVVCLETRYKDGIWTQQTIDYADGRRVTEYRDSRKKTKEEHHGLD